MKANELLKRINIMINTGASKDVTLNYVDFLLNRGVITTRCYELAIGTINDRY